MSAEVDQKPLTLQGVLLQEEKDPEVRKALEVIGEQTVQIDAKDMRSQGDGADEVVLPGPDAVDYSNITLTTEEEKMDVAMAPVKVTTASSAQDEMDFDAPEQLVINPLPISQTVLDTLTRRVNGKQQIRHSELYLLAVNGAQDEWLPQPASTSFVVPPQKIFPETDEAVSFEKLPGRDKPEENAMQDEAEDADVVALPPWDPSQIGFPFVAPEPKVPHFLDHFSLPTEEAAALRAHFALNDSAPSTSMSVSTPPSHTTLSTSTPTTTYSDDIRSSGYDGFTVESPSYSATTEDYGDEIPELERMVHPVQHTPWELDIIWDREDEDDNESLHGVDHKTHSQAQHSLQDMETNADGDTFEDTADMDVVTGTETSQDAPQSFPRYGRDQESVSTKEPELPESMFRATKSLTLPKDSPFRSTLVSEDSFPALTSDFIAPNRPKISSSVFPAYNRRLDELEWLDRVVWDDTDLGQVRRLAPLNAKVEVDMSDVHILLEEEGAHHEESPKMDDEGSADATLAANVKKQIRKRHLQLKTKTTDLHRSRLDALNHFDKFNLSRDAYYLDGIQARTREKKSLKLVHSPYALRNVLLRRTLSTENCMAFHRPKIRMLVNLTNHIHPHTVLAASARKKSRGLEVMKHRRDLSAREGRVVLFEYTEEFPPALSDIGMACRIANYVRKEARSVEDAPVLAYLEKEESESSKVNVVSEEERSGDGEDIFLDKTVDLPFLGDIAPGARLQAVHNNLFRAPIFKHLPEKSDFLMIRPHSGIDASSITRGKAHNLSAQHQMVLTSFYVRDIPAIYLVGQQEPEREVPAPGSRADNEYVKTRLEQYVYYLLALAKQQTGKAEVKLATVHQYFPRTETATRKVLRKFTSFDRTGDGTWTFDPTDARPTLPTDAEIEAMTSLDDACLFDCQQAVLNRLRQLGIPVQVDMTNLHRNVKTLYDRQDPRFSIGRFIAEELELAAWNLTSNFIDSAHSKSILQLAGLGDPSGVGQAFSYLRLPMKIANLKRDKEREAGVVVTGTASDLRQLTLPQLDTLLRQEGVKEDTLASLKRWKKVDLLREIANKRKKQEAEDSADINKFARFSKHSVETHQGQYNDRIKLIFASQIAALTYKEEEDETDADLASVLGDEDGDAGMSVEKPAEEIEQTEIEQYFRFINSLEVTKPGEETGEQSAAPTRPGSPSPVTPGSSTASNSNTTTVTRLVEDIVTLDPTTGMPAKPGVYAKITTTSTYGIEKVVWSQDPAKIEQARQASAALAKTSTAKRAKATRPKKAANPDAKPIKCGRCGGIGHNRNSPSCPKFDAIVDDDKKKKKPTKPRSKKPKSDSEEEEEIIEDDWIEEEEDDGEETPEEDFADDVGIAAQRKIQTPVISAGGTKLVINRLAPTTSRRRAVAKRKRADFMDFGDEEEDDDDFDFYSSREAAPSPRKRTAKARVKADSPQGELNHLLRQSLDAVYTLPQFHLFKSKVDKSILPDYYTVIKHPMYMDLISSRLRSLAYTSVASYLADWELLRNNCYTYNQTTSPELLPLVDDLYNRVTRQVSAIGDDRLRLLEDAVRVSNPSAPSTPAPFEGSPPQSSSSMLVDHDDHLDIM